MSAAIKFTSIPISSIKKWVSCLRTSNRRCSIDHSSISNIFTCNEANKVVKVKGWVKGIRKLKERVFVDVNDGSSCHALQIVINSSLGINSNLSFGCAIEVQGTLLNRTHSFQKVELHADSCNILGKCDKKAFPFKIKAKHDADYIRNYIHLRSKTSFFSSVLRVRSEASSSVHRFFKENGFIEIHTPILTSNDCEGAGDTFRINSPESYHNNKEQNVNFFDVPTYLNVSGQLHLEAVLGGISKVYTFNPAFRAENSQTRRHLAEFYMVEAEMAFVDNMDLLLNLIEHLVKSVIKYVIEQCREDLQLILKSKAHSNMLNTITSTPFVRLSYSEAFQCLMENKDKLSQPPVDNGDLEREQELLLVKLHNNIPVFITDYPKNNKPFYMKRCPNSSNVKSVDLLAPFVGELCGGSLREDDEIILQENLEQNSQQNSLNWYLDLRKYGDSPHAGFGLGFERLLLLITGLKNIKDVIPFPRWSHNCEL